MSDPLVHAVPDIAAGIDQAMEGLRRMRVSTGDEFYSEAWSQLAEQRERIARQIREGTPSPLVLAACIVGAGRRVAL